MKLSPRRAALAAVPLLALSGLAASAVPASAATQWSWTHKVDHASSGWFEVIVSVNAQHDFWYAKASCAGGTGNKDHKTVLGAESTSTGHSTAHCPSGYTPYAGYIIRGGYSNDEIWSA